MSGVTIGCLVFGALIVTLMLVINRAVYLLKPWPIISYCNAVPRTHIGKVTKIEHICRGVTEVAITPVMEIDPATREGNPQPISASVVCYVYFREGQDVPSTGLVIAVSSINRVHRFVDRFTARSFNWVEGWEPFHGTVPAVDQVRIVRPIAQLSLI